MRAFFAFLAWRKRLIGGVLLGLLTWWLLSPMPLAPVTRALLAFDVGCTSYLVLVFLLMWQSGRRGQRPRALQEDEGAYITLLLTILAALVALAAIMLEMAQAGTTPGIDQWKRPALAVLTIVLAWLLTHVMFALHYAHLYYQDVAEGRPVGLIFPEPQPCPDYWDFVYFAFVIGTSAQTADVAFGSARMRRLGTLHCILAFFYNVSVLALMINIAAGLLGG